MPIVQGELALSPEWRWRFLGLAAFVAGWSKDQSTKCGAVLVRPDKTIASAGFNGFPQALHDHTHLLGDRKDKLDRIIHAEMNALLFLREPGAGLWLFVHPMLPCHRCAVHAIQAGISCVVAPTDSHERWSESMDLTKRLFSEAGVQTILEDSDATEKSVESVPGHGRHRRPDTRDVLQVLKSRRGNGPEYDL